MIIWYNKECASSTKSNILDRQENNIDSETLLLFSNSFSIWENFSCNCSSSIKTKRFTSFKASHQINNVSYKNFASNKGGFSFFSQEGWKNCRWGASHMQYAILDASEEA